MKRFAYLIGAAAILVSAPLVVGQHGNPFVDHSDDGEILHVLPTPAALHSPHDTAPTFAEPSSQSSIQPASYGSGNLVNHGGPQIANAGFQAIFWNSAVANASSTSGSYATIKEQIDGFINDFPALAPFSNSAADDYGIIQQYGTAATPISYSLQRYAYFVDSQPSQGSISDSKIRSYIAGLFSSNKVTPYDNVIYGVYFPAGMKITAGGTSCSSFCGYHSYFTYNGHAIKYAVFPYLSCSACKLSNLSVGDMLTIVTSHEIREAVTDPKLNSWYDAAGYEADDKCAWHNLYQTNNGGHWVQPEYSNGAAGYPGPGCYVAR
jgi:hypothetical protein